ncbi:MAG: hypothetical protein AAGF98_03860 [Cyanobacteria bacterium P01_H01_bin.153]
MERFMGWVDAIAPHIEGKRRVLGAISLAMKGKHDATYFFSA